MTDVWGLYPLSKVTVNMKFENTCTQYTEKEAITKGRQVVLGLIERIRFSSSPV